ncbi:MDR family MFS transporter [Shouchella shacheensis]|uniref:MDR family MFS transporter n=1 Tax=Shouchella shacheensis TaxID=1649580 RepID=UPI00074000B1|nr:MDR family MFS transporter [Shouchella shacheensis]
MKETNRPVVLAAILLAMFMAAVEATIVATVMPRIVGDLGGFALFSWVFSSYLLMQVVTIPIYGKLADIYGRKLVFTIGVTIFLIGSLLCGFASGMEWLIVFRFIQGLGAGAVQPMATTIVGDMYTKEERAQIQGYLSSVWGISAVAGPFLGSLFVEYIHWAWVFWVNIPLGVIAVLGVVLFLKEPAREESRHVDYSGSVLLLVGMVPFMVILVQGGQTLLWTSLWTWALLGLSISAFFAFVQHERNAREPLVTFSLWKKKAVWTANVGALTTGAITLAVSSFLPTYVQGVLNQTALIAGLSLTTMSIGWPISAVVAGKMLLKTGFKKTAIIGGVSLTIGTMLYLLMYITGLPWLAALASLVTGIGMGFTSTTYIVSLQSEVSWKMRGEATAMNMFSRQLGGAVGVAFLGGLLNSQLSRQLSEDAEELSFVPSLESVNRLLEGGAELTGREQQLLSESLSQGLLVVFIAILALALITLIVNACVPKGEDATTRERQ